MQLDADYGARSASLADVYLDLGFEETAVRVAERAKRASSGEFGAYKILADIYANKPSARKAAASEYLQAQMRQPLTSLPLRPILVENGLQVLAGAGPSSLGVSEYNTLTTKNQHNFLLSAAGGSKSTEVLNAMISGLHDRQSYLLESYNNESEDLFSNGDINYTIHSFYYQVKPNESINVFLDLVSNDFDKVNTIEVGSQENTESEYIDAFRVGVGYRPNLNLSVLSSVRYRERVANKFKITVVDAGTEDEYTETFADESDSDIIDVDVMGTYKKGGWRGELGVYHSASDIQKKTILIEDYIDDETEVTPLSDASETSTFTKYYAYLSSDFNEQVSWLIGLSEIIHDDEVIYQQKFERTAKKVGLNIHPRQWFNIDLVYVEDLTAPNYINQSLEPTHIYGVQQLTDGFFSSESDSLVLKVDSSYNGWDVNFLASDRDVVVPVVPSGDGFYFKDFEQRHTTFQIRRAVGRFALGIGLDMSSIDLSRTWDTELPIELDTKALPLDIRFFSKYGYSFSATWTRVFQDGVNNPDLGMVPSITHAFSVLDMSAGYMWKGFGAKSAVLSLDIRNVLDETFEYRPESVFDNSNTGGQDGYAIGRSVVGRLDRSSGDLLGYFSRLFI